MFWFFGTRKRSFTHCLARNSITCAVLAATSFHDYEQLSFLAIDTHEFEDRIFDWRWETMFI
jgi:hypothetical protein